MTFDELLDRFPRTAAVVQQGIERRLHHGAQIYISRGGEVLADVGIGLASPDVPMTADTINPWLSAGKPLTAVLMAQLVEDGRLGWDDSVSSHLPEFGAHGKESITVRHLLTHTAGLHAIDAGWPDVDWNASLRRIFAAALDPEWIVGESAAYDPGSSWFVLGEIAQRATRLRFADALTQHVLHPAGMQSTWTSLTATEFEVSQHRLGWMWERQQGQLVPTDWHKSPRCTISSPGSSLHGPIRDLGRFYEWLPSREWRIAPSTRHAQGLPRSRSRQTSDERPKNTEFLRIPLQERADGIEETMRWPPIAAAALTEPQRVGQFDQTLGHVVDFGLGFLLDSNRYGPDTVPYGYGRDCSPRTFGHGGAQCSQGYCDPDNELVVAYVFNGRPGEGQHQRRVRALNDAVYQDLRIEAADQ